MQRFMEINEFAFYVKSNKQSVLHYTPTREKEELCCKDSITDGIYIEIWGASDI